MKDRIHLSAFSWQFIIIVGNTGDGSIQY
jgi:hypothetical protein